MFMNSNREPPPPATLDDAVSEIRRLRQQLLDSNNKWAGQVFDRWAAGKSLLERLEWKRVERYGVSDGDEARGFEAALSDLRKMVTP